MRMDEWKVENSEPSRSRAIMLFALMLACGLPFAFTSNVFVLSLIPGPVQGMRDFVAFWATGQLLAHHANPYDAAALLQLERAAGFPSHYDVMYMLNPPWNLPLVYPLGFLNASNASILWSLIEVGCFAGSVDGALQAVRVVNARVPRAGSSRVGDVIADAVTTRIRGRLIDARSGRNNEHGLSG